MKKKVLMILLAAMLVLGGCGSKAVVNASESVVEDTFAASQAETSTTEALKQENTTSDTESKEKTVKEESKPGKVEKEEAPVHTHSYTQQVISEATCTTGALVANVCSECGANGGTSDAGGVLGHDLQRHVDGEATCTYSPNYYVRCSRCGEVTESGHEGILPHNMVVVSVQEGDCVTPTVTQYACSDCGTNGGSEYSVLGDHDWVEGLSAPYWSEEAQDFVQDPTTYCSRCNTHQ